MSAPRTLYNLGSGPRRLLMQLPDGSAFKDWKEVRVDVDANCKPDIQADLTDLTKVIPDMAAGLVYCSHVIEHFFDHDVSKVLKELTRILHPEGAVVLRVPDLAAVVRSLDEGNLERVLYSSPSGPIRALDVIYGHRRSIRQGNAFMAHHTGFTETSLARRMLAAGFDEVRTVPGPAIDFCTIATLGPTAFAEQVEAILSYINS